LEAEIVLLGVPIFRIDGNIAVFAGLVAPVVVCGPASEDVRVRNGRRGANIIVDPELSAVGNEAVHDVTAPV
jgi:hypothetical protein